MQEVLSGVGCLPPDAFPIGQAPWAGAPPRLSDEGSVALGGLGEKDFWLARHRHACLRSSRYELFSS